MMGKILAILLMLSSSIAGAVTPTIGEFFQQLNSNALSPTRVKTPGKPVEFLRTQFSKTQIDFNDQSAYKLGDELTMTRSIVDSNGLRIEATSTRTGKAYNIVFTSQVRQEATLYNIQREFGLIGPENQLLENVPVRMTKHQLQQLQRIWPRHPEKLKWTDFWNGYDLKDDGIEINKALLISLDAGSTDTGWRDLESSDSRSMALFALWLQCEDLISEKNIWTHKRVGQSSFTGFGSCLGFGLRSGTPNMFAPNVFNLAKKRNRHESWEYNIVARDPEFRRILAKIELQDIYDFLNRTESFSQRSLQTTFENYGYPEIYAELVSAKLTTRRNQMIDLVSKYSESKVVFTRHSLKTDIAYLGDGEHIQDGIVVKDFPDVKLDQTNTLISVLMENVAKPALKNIEYQAKQMLAQFPYTGIELLHFGKSFVGVGILFRLKRSVRRNPESTGGDDRYLVQDTVKIGFTGNVGRNFKYTRRLNLWLSGGVGYAKMVSYKKLVASPEEASKQYWLIPYKLLFEKDFNHLEPGETLATQRGIIGIGGGGGNIKYSRKVRPAGYLLFGLNFFNNFQVTRTKSDDLYIIQGEDDSWSFSGKLFFRILSRFFRIPFTGYNYRSGVGYSKTFHIPASTYNNLDGKELLEFQTLLRHTLDDRDIESLKEVVGYTKTDFDYSLSSSFINIWGTKSRTSKSNGDFLVEAEPEIEAEYGFDSNLYYLANLEEISSQGRTEAENTTGCRVGGVLQYSDQEKTEIDDGIMNFRCSITAGVESDEQREKLSSFLGEQLGFDNESIQKFFAQIPNKNFQLKATYEGKIYWASLQQIILPTEDNSHAFIDSFLSSYLGDQTLDGNLKFKAMDLRQQFWQFSYNRNPEWRLDQLQQYLFDEFDYRGNKGVGFELQKHIFALMPEKKINLKLEVFYKNNTDTYDLETGIGTEQTSSANNYYEWREKAGNKGIIDDL